MTPIAPSRELDQRHAALAAANEIRYRRAEMKRNMRHLGPHLAALAALHIVTKPPHWAETMKIRNLLVALPFIGDAKADRVLIQLRINPRKTLAGLSPRQRTEIAQWLDQRARARTAQQGKGGEGAWLG